MDKCCASQSYRRPQRRLNGLQLPLNYLQIIGWFVFISTGCLNFSILIEIQFDELKTISLVIFVVLYVCHITSHLTALLLDPSEKELRRLKVYNVPEFDRDVHAHVIENGRCHLCNIHTSSKKTKHCSICNKCVDHFDHHCKWLNNCVGGRNYVAFIACVATALMISIFTSSLCVADLVIFFTNPMYFSIEAQNFINCTEFASTTQHYCRNSISFLILLIFLCVVASAIGCALIHLCCFHVYISILGISTYEYVVRNTESQAPYYRYKCCRLSISPKFYVVRKPKEQSTSLENNFENEPAGSKLDVSNPQIDVENGEANVINFISILLNSELDRAKRMFLYDKNKVHPQESNSS